MPERSGELQTLFRPLDHIFNEVARVEARPSERVLCARDRPMSCKICLTGCCSRTEAGRPLFAPERRPICIPGVDRIAGTRAEPAIMPPPHSVEATPCESYQQIVASNWCDALPQPASSRRSSLQIGARDSGSPTSRFLPLLARLGRFAA